MVWGWFHKSWAHRRDSLIHLRSTRMPNFWEYFYWHKSLAQGAKVHWRVQHSLWNGRPLVKIDAKMLSFLMWIPNFTAFKCLYFLFSIHTIPLNGPKVDKTSFIESCLIREFFHSSIVSWIWNECSTRIWFETNRVV